MIWNHVCTYIAADAPLWESCVPFILGISFNSFLVNYATQNALNGGLWWCAWSAIYIQGCIHMCVHVRKGPGAKGVGAGPAVGQNEGASRTERDLPAATDAANKVAALLK